MCFRRKISYPTGLNGKNSNITRTRYNENKTTIKENSSSAPKKIENRHITIGDEKNHDQTNFASNIKMTTTQIIGERSDSHSITENYPILHTPIASSGNIYVCFLLLLLSVQDALKDDSDDFH